MRHVDDAPPFQASATFASISAALAPRWKPPSTQCMKATLPAPSAWSSSAALWTIWWRAPGIDPRELLLDPVEAADQVAEVAALGRRPVGLVEVELRERLVEDREDPAHVALLEQVEADPPLAGTEVDQPIELLDHPGAELFQQIRTAGAVAQRFGGDRRGPLAVAFRRLGDEVHRIVTVHVGEHCRHSRRSTDEVKTTRVP